MRRVAHAELIGAGDAGSLEDSRRTSDGVVQLTVREDGAVPCRISDFQDLVAQLDGVSATEHGQWTRYRAGRTFGYLWPATATVGLRQILAEQAALVAERPEVFEKQFTAHGFGWVVVHLAGIDRDELAELVFEAWRLSAPEELVTERAERLPR